jgi:hypothetical protein
LTAVGILFGAGCAKTLEPTDVAHYLNSTLADDTPYRVAGLAVEAMPGPEGKFLVRFKADLLAEEDLYLRVGAAEELAKSGWKEAELDGAIQTAAQLPSDLAEKVDKHQPERAVGLFLLKQSVSPGDRRAWSGTVDANYVEGRWTFSNLAGEKREPFEGERRSSFPPDAIVLGSPEAKDAIADLIAARRRYVDSVAAAQATSRERESRQQADERAVADAKARQAAAQQQAEMRAADVRARQAAAQQQVAEARARQAQAAQQRADAARRQIVPVRVTFRRSTMGRGAVALVQNPSPEPLEMKLTITDGFKTTQRLLQMRPASLLEIGWLQGWDFKSGDVLVFEHRQYLPARFRTP